MEKQVSIIVFGRVQGVGFRYFIKTKAQKLGLKGWVQNQADGSVKIKAKGDKEKIKELVNWCNKGSLFTQIEKIQIKEQKTENDLKDFTIIY